MKAFAFGLGYTAKRVLSWRRGVEAAGTARDPAAAAPVDDAMRLFAFDGERGGLGLEAALSEAEIVIVSIPPDPLGDPTLRVFADAIGAARRLRRLIYLSTVGVYAETGGRWVDEASPTAIRGRGAARVLAEAAWREMGARRGVAVDVLRLAGIYGPGRNALVKLREGRARRIVKQGQVFNRIHVDDIAAATWRLIEADGPGEVWNLADEEPAAPQDVVTFAAELLGLPVPPEENFERAQMSPMARSFYEGNRRVDIGKLKRELGYRLIYPDYRAGLRALAAAGEGSPRRELRGSEASS